MFESFINIRNDTDRNCTDIHVNIYSNIIFSKTPEAAPAKNQPKAEAKADSTKADSTTKK